MDRAEPYQIIGPCYENSRVGSGNYYEHNLLTEFLEIWHEQLVVGDGPSRVLLTPSKYCMQFYDARQTCGMGIPLQALTVQSIEGTLKR